MSEELRPCPFCGISGAVENVWNSDHDTFLTDCSACGTGQIVESHWNNAFAWKEIDRLKSRVEELGDQLLAKDRRIAELEGALRVADEICDAVVVSGTCCAAPSVYKVVERYRGAKKALAPKEASGEEGKQI